MCNFTEMKNKIYMHTSDKILPWWLSGKKKKKKKERKKERKRFAYQYRRLGFYPCFGKISGKMAMHCSILAWELPWTEEPSRIWVFLVAQW